MTIRWPVLSSLALCANACFGLGTPQLSQLRALGYNDSSAAYPYSEVILGTDGTIYGTTSIGGQANQGTVFRINQDGSGVQLLKTFGVDSNDGSRPFSGLLEAKDGLLYGTTEEGGAFGFGTIFRLGKDGSNFSVLKSFSGAADGAYPEAALLEASDGLLYGTASGGGTNDSGVVFRLAKDGTEFSLLVKFAGTNGANPEASLIEASDGMLYGTTFSADQTNLGTVFRLQKDGSNFKTLKKFFNTSTVKTNGTGPESRLIEGTNGVLFGTTSGGGLNTAGTIFQLNKDGTGFRSVYHFRPIATQDGRYSHGNLLLASEGNLYGTTFDGGTNGNGTMFSINEDGTNYTLITSLVLAQGPASGLIEGTNGLLYGTTQLGGDSGAGTLFSIQKDGTGFTIMKSLSPTGGDGQSPYSAPIAANSNSLYGTTRLGGNSAAGTIYAMRFDGLGYQVISSLDPALAEPINPIGPLFEATNGMLYGISTSGGTSNNGAIFSLEEIGGNLNFVYDFTNASDGRQLRAGLIQASDGVLYGTATLGGSANQGTAFRINPDGSAFTVLKNFATGASGPGAHPMESLLEGSDGVLYGTTYDGGVSNKGVVFSLTRDGGTYTILKAFGAPSSDGENPMSPLLEASDGLLYGLAYGGGGTNNAGTLFRVKRDGTGFGTILTFAGLGEDGRHPCGSLVEWNDKALYGATERGGTNDQGTLFRVNKDGSGYGVLANFGGELGAYPRSGLVRGPDGALYGATDQGGQMGFGTIFRYGVAFGDIADLQIVNQIPIVTGVGIPGTNYILERTSDLGPTGSWTPISFTNAPANGLLTIPDISALIGGAQPVFYRLKY